MAQVKDRQVLLRVCNPHPFVIELPSRRPLARVSRLGPDDVQAPNQLVLRRRGEQVVEVDVRPVHSALPANLSGLFQQADGLTPGQQGKLQALLDEWQGVFARDEEDYGRTRDPRPTSAEYQALGTSGKGVWGQVKQLVVKEGVLMW